MIIDKKAVGNRIQSIRKRKGLTMKEFGKLVGDAAQSLVSRWEKGDNLPNNERLKIIAALGSATVNELLYGDFQHFCFTLFQEVDDELIEEYPALQESDAFVFPDKRYDFYLEVYTLLRERKASYEDVEMIKKIYKVAFMSEYEVIPRAQLEEFDKLSMQLSYTLARMLDMAKESEPDIENVDEYQNRKEKIIQTLKYHVAYLEKEIKKLS